MHSQMESPDLIVIGGGLAGSEAAWQAAQRGLRVHLYEMRPLRMTGAHQTADLAELVCSNSLGSRLPDRASGLLQNELRRLSSMLLACAEETALPAGSALAVDRVLFAQKVTERIQQHPKILVICEEVTEIPSLPTIISSGPLTSPALTQAIVAWTGEEHLSFYDAISPIVTAESINMEIAFRASRYRRGEAEEGDYINCPMTRQEYEAFVDALLSAERIELRAFEEEIRQGVRAGVERFFEGCLPIEILAERGREALAFGPLRPVGLIDPRTGKRPYAVVQLRQDNLIGDLYNMVVPDQFEIFGAATRLPHDSGAGTRRVRALWTDALKYLHRLAPPALAHPAIASASRPVLCRADHQGRGVHGEHCDRSAGRLERRASAARAATCDPAGSNHAGGAVSLCDSRILERFPAHESQFWHPSTPGKRKTPG
jgi:folate-dependent tRNA-U54 methylase TrmFO/GidA